MKIDIDFGDYKSAELLTNLAEQQTEESELAAYLFEGYPTLDEENEDDLAKIRAGVERGLADFAAGRYKSASEVYARMKARHGIPD